MEELYKELCEQIEKQLEVIKSQKVQQGNIDYLGKLIDVSKDLKNIEYWKEKIEMYRGNYGNYGNFDNYRESGNYGARGYDSKYRGEEKLGEVYNEYGRYMNARSYGDANESDRSFHYMVKSLEDFARTIFEEAQTPEQKQMIKETARRIAEM